LRVTALVAADWQVIFFRQAAESVDGVAFVISGFEARIDFLGSVTIVERKRKHRLLRNEAL
jgi:hypothetical protein